jgi:hypothetical protein
LFNGDKGEVLIMDNFFWEGIAEGVAVLEVVEVVDWNPERHSWTEEASNLACPFRVGGGGNGREEGRPAVAGAEEDDGSGGEG